MRMRFCATIRRPAFSIMALIAPVRLRVVASGLRMEKVRSSAMKRPWLWGIGLAGRGLIAAPSMTGNTLERDGFFAAAARQPPPFGPDEPSGVPRRLKL